MPQTFSDGHGKKPTPGHGRTTSIFLSRWLPFPISFPSIDFSPDEFSVITSIMAGEDQSYDRNDSFSSTNMSRCAISNLSCAMLADHQDPWQLSGVV